MFVCSVYAVLCVRPTPIASLNIERDYSKVYNKTIYIVLQYKLDQNLHL